MRLFKGTLIGAACFAASAAAAADLPRSHYYVPEPMAPLPPAFTWTGLYAGVNAGMGRSDHDKAKTHSPTRVRSTSQFMRQSNDAAFIGGGQIGYNYQFGSFVVGIETDIDYADLKDRATGSFKNGAFQNRLHMQSKLDWFGSTRARFGFLPTDHLLIYGTGGVAYGSVKTAVSDYSTDPLISLKGGAHKSDVRTGWALGAGVEYALSRNISLKGEYIYTDLGKKSFVFHGNHTDYTIGSKANFGVVRAGLNWKFN